MNEYKETTMTDEPDERNEISLTLPNGMFMFAALLTKHAVIMTTNRGKARLQKNISIVNTRL